MPDPATKSLSIKNVPEDLLQRLRERAKAHRRSLQAELLVILEEAVAHRPPQRKLTLAEAAERIKTLGLKTPDQATQWIREDRDSR